MLRFSIGVWALVCLWISFPLKAQEASVDREAVGSIEVLDPAFRDLIEPKSRIEVLTTGYQWSEGPVWIKDKGVLLFSDVPKNKIHCWSPKNGHSIFMDQSGYEGKNGEKEPGSNGLMTDAEGRLVVCDHGNRRVYRVESDGSKTTLADKFEGKRFNSPNDLVIHSSGAIYFTDPPYGLRDEAKREIDYCGVYRVGVDGKVTLLTKELERPNGIALSPDEKTLYVAQSHGPAPIYNAYSIKPDGTTDANGKTIFNSVKYANQGDPGMPDGMCVDVQGNLWASGPGGILVISPAGKLLGRLMMGKPTANCAFGGDGSTLFITSSDRICRVQTKTKGLGF
ncbi:MAG: SMP-30/gluconolactonase/LRE family protein [Pirellulales bacterium]|jgi:gluconolactonase